MITVITYNTHNYHGGGELKTNFKYFHMLHGELLVEKNITKHLIDHADKGNDYTLRRAAILLSSNSASFSYTYNLSDPCYINSLMI